jgi:hypothetical protein
LEVVCDEPGIGSDGEYCGVDDARVARPHQNLLPRGLGK